jgi:hypothetical protein
MRRTSVALVVTLLAGLAAFAWIGWRSTAPTTQLVGANVGRVTGEVVVEGGAAVSNPASDIQPIRPIAESTPRGDRRARRMKT